MLFPADIQALRQKSGLKLAEFGRKIGASESAVCKWEKGVQHPRFETMVRIVEFARTLDDKPAK